MKKMKKWQIGAISAAAVLVIGFGGYSLLGGGSTSSSNVEVAYVTATAKEGSVASSVLLSGTVTANGEQYVYFDATKGDLENVLVNVGDQVTAGQALVQYKSAEAQAAYDAAQRAVAKIDRQIYELKTYGVVVETTGDAETDQSTTAKTQRTVDDQYKDLQDSRADAVSQVNKAKAALDDMTVTSTVDGTVVEVNRNVSKSTTGSSQTLVHIVNNGKLQVKGELSEYNLANLAVGQEVELTSKVYPDKKWAGKISYISDYPKESQAAATGSTTGGAKYPFTVDLLDDAGELKQGFSVNMEVKNTSQGILVPVTALVTEGDKNYVWVVDKNQTAKKKEVTLGNADAENQEIKSGLGKDEKVISNPTSELQEGQEVKADENTDQSK